MYESGERTMTTVRELREKLFQVEDQDEEICGNIEYLDTDKHHFYVLWKVNRGI